MAQTATKLPRALPFPHGNLWQKVAVVLMLLPIAACSHVDYSMQEQNFASVSHANATRTIGNIYVNFSDSEYAKPYAMEVNEVRDYYHGFGGSNHGYALSAPIYSSQDSSTHLHLTSSRTTDHDWFNGLQMRWSF